MSTEPTFRSAWRWASEWRGSTTFWLAEVISGVAFGVVVLVLTGNIGWATAAFALGAVLAFLGGIAWNAILITVERRRRFRAAVEKIVAGEYGANESRPQGRSETEKAIGRFNSYVEKQVEKLKKEREWQSQVEGSPNWSDFAGIAWRTVRGIRRFDSTLGSYVEAPITDDWGEPMPLDDSDARRFIEAVIETQDLFDGQDPSTKAPF